MVGDRAMLSGMETTTRITTVTPRLVVHDAAAAIDFYARALGAAEEERHEHDGKVVHALVLIDDQPIALKDADDVDPSPRSLGGSPVILSVDVPDARAVADRMIEAGARVVFAVDDHGYGYLDGRVEDPFGHLWLLSQRLE
jgi:PhnB protein